MDTTIICTFTSTYVSRLEHSTVIVLEFEKKKQTRLLPDTHTPNPDGNPNPNPDPDPDRNPNPDGNPMSLLKKSSLKLTFLLGKTPSKKENFKSAASITWLEMWNIGTYFIMQHVL